MPQSQTRYSPPEMCTTGTSVHAHRPRRRAPRPPGAHQAPIPMLPRLPSSPPTTEIGLARASGSPGRSGSGHLARPEGSRRPGPFPNQTVFPVGSELHGPAARRVGNATELLRIQFGLATIRRSTQNPRRARWLPTRRKKKGQSCATANRRCDPRSDSIGPVGTTSLPVAMTGHDNAPRTVPARREQVEPLHE